MLMQLNVPPETVAERRIRSNPIVKALASGNKSDVRALISSKLVRPQDQAEVIIALSEAVALLMQERAGSGG